MIEQKYAKTEDKQETPILKTEPELDGIGNLEVIALDIEDCSVIDLSVKRDSQKKSLPFTDSKKVYAYIRPLGNDIEDLLKEGEEKTSYLFHGLEVEQLKKRFESATHGIKPEESKEILKEVYEYKYNMSDKEKICAAVKILAG
ncbi:MAG: hypothetical protein PHH54_00410 [Candidatus Nanoarchaeia archaeon]|nr:hypothetical protein [Candidatus Nanoarchaeia archaeon]MDD5740425.1 hypothetical protein [Candidatus Nanoarchaeia archaeon]